MGVKNAFRIEMTCDDPSCGFICALSFWNSMTKPSKIGTFMYEGKVYYETPDVQTAVEIANKEMEREGEAKRWTCVLDETGKEILLCSDCHPIQEKVPETDKEASPLPF